MPPPAGSLLGVLSGSPSKSNPRLSSWTEPGTSAASDRPLKLEGPERPTLSRSLGPCMSYRSWPPRLGPPAPGSISELPQLQLTTSFPCPLAAWGTCLPGPGPCPFRPLHTPDGRAGKWRWSGWLLGWAEPDRHESQGHPAHSLLPLTEIIRLGVSGCGTHWVGFWVPKAKRAQGAPTLGCCKSPDPPVYSDALAASAPA